MVVVDHLEKNHEFVGEAVNFVLHHLGAVYLLLQSQAKDSLHLPPDIDGAGIEIFSSLGERGVRDPGEVSSNLI